VEARNVLKLSRFNKIILWINYLVIILLLGAISAPYISPSVFWPLAFLGLAFPIIFLINFIFAAYWLIQLKKQMLFSLVAFMVAFPLLNQYIGSGDTDKNLVSKSLKITSYNCMLFDLYNWKKNKQSREQIFVEMAEINSDVYCFQEYYTSEEAGDFNNSDTLPVVLNTGYHHIEYTSTLREFDHWGIATFSKFPIINKGKITFNTRNNNICIYSDIVKNKDTIRVYNVHLQSISFSKADNKYLEELKQGVKTDYEVEKSKNILRRLKRAFVKRAHQVQAMKEHISASPYKVIICGDFNDTPASYTYRKLKNRLKDAFLEKGSGIGKTYAGPWPQFRIDYILHDKAIQCQKFIRHPETITDHYPISAYFSLPE